MIGRGDMMGKRKSWAAVATAMVLASVGVTQASRAAPAPAPVPSVAPATPQDMGPWTDAYFTENLRKTRVPGAVVIIVDHGKVVFAKGYGVTAAGGGKPVDVDTTLFRIGSISKVFTALSASQMIEEGAIDPTVDINRYLKRVQVPNRFDRPVTAGDLLVHQGGFGAELRGVDAATDAAADISPKEMQRLLVPRVRPPGLYPAYDNNGWGLLGLSLADASGQSYRDLTARRWFGPLGMTHSVVGVPADRVMDAAHDHHVSPDGAVKEIDWSLLKPMEQGAGDISSTGSDMARFMIALLQKGELEGKTVISPSVYAAVTDFDAHRLHPALPGYGRALYEDRPAGRFAIRHDGGMSGSAASMELYPEAQIGVFFAINARPENPFDGETLGGLIRGIRMFLAGGKSEVSLDDFLKFLKFHEAFAARYIPAPATPPPAPVAPGSLWTTDQLRALQGTYVGTSSDYASFIGKLQVNLIEGRPVILSPDGKLKIGGDPYTQVAPGLFSNDKTGVRLAFVHDKGETFLGESWLWRQHLRPAWKSPLFLVVPLVLFPILLLSGLVYLKRTSARRRLGLGAAGLGVAYLAGWVLEAEFATGLFVAGWTPVAVLWRLAFSLVVAGLALWPILMARSWYRSPPTLSVKGVIVGIHLVLISALCWYLVWLAGVWGLVNPFR
jgi:CubicO group peptidase (beta-lactamase class C family)